MDQVELAAAIAAQEEHIKRSTSCRGVIGVAHKWRQLSNPETGVAFEACGVCDVTKSSGDYEARIATSLRPPTDQETARNLAAIQVGTEVTYKGRPARVTRVMLPPTAAVPTAELAYAGGWSGSAHIGSLTVRPAPARTGRPQILTQSKFFNSGQPDGFSPTSCPRCAGTGGSSSGSKCSTCQGHGRIYVQDEKREES